MHPLSNFLDLPLGSIGIPPSLLHWTASFESLLITVFHTFLLWLFPLPGNADNVHCHFTFVPLIVVWTSLLCGGKESMGIQKFTKMSCRFCKAILSNIFFDRSSFLWCVFVVSSGDTLLPFFLHCSLKALINCLSFLVCQTSLPCRAEAEGCFAKYIL